MKRRSRAGGKPVKTRPARTVTSRRGNAPKAERGRSPPLPIRETTRSARPRARRGTGEADRHRGYPAYISRSRSRYIRSSRESLTLPCGCSLAIWRFCSVLTVELPLHGRRSLVRTAWKSTGKRHFSGSRASSALPRSADKSLRIDDDRPIRTREKRRQNRGASLDCVPLLREGVHRSCIGLAGARRTVSGPRNRE